MESPIIEEPTSPEIKELLTSAYTYIERNGYRTTGEPIPISVAGQLGIWHSLKGGINPERLNSGQASFKTRNQVLHNPETDEWLKLVPPEAENWVPLKTRLKTSIDVLKAALIVADLPEFVDQIVEYQDLSMRGHETYGFISPHLGITLQFITRKYLADPTEKNADVKFPPIVSQYLGLAYSISFRQAVRLYLDYEYWMADPNPGNIYFVHKKDGTIRILNTDFDNSKQIKEHKAEKNNRGRAHDIRELFDLYKSATREIEQHSDQETFSFYDKPGDITKLIDEELSARPHLN